MKKLPVLALLVLCILMAGAAHASDEEKVVRDNWYIIYTHGIKSGYDHDTTVSIPGKKLIRTVTEVVHKTRRGDDIVETPSTTVYVETEDGRPVSFLSRDRESAQDTVIEGTIEGETARVKVTTYGKVEEKVIPWDGRIIFSAAQDRLLKQKGFAKGTTVEYYGFEIDLLKASRQVCTMEGDEEVPLLDGKKVLHKMSLAYDLHPELRLMAWCDDDVLPHRVYMSLGQNDLYLTTKEKALAMTPSSADMMEKTSIPLTVRLPFFYRLDEIVYRLSFKEKFDALRLVDPRQELAGSSPGAVDLRVRSLPFDKTPDPPETLADRELYLRETPYLQWKDPVVQKLTQKALAGATAPALQARTLRAWIYRNLKKNYATGFASAREVSETLSGDCTEHAVLLAAMLRVCGIPSRVAVGLICVGDDFGWHMWTQAFLGRWVDLDATTPFDDCAPNHIRLGDSPLKDTGIEEILAATNLIGSLRIDVLRYTMKGKSIDPAKAPDEYFIKDGWYVNSFSGFRFYKPRAWEFFTREELEKRGQKAAVALLNPQTRSAIVVDCNEGAATKEALLAEMPATYQVTKAQELKLKGCTGYEFSVYEKSSGTNGKFLFIVSARATYIVILPLWDQEGERGYQTVVNSFELLPD